MFQTNQGPSFPAHQFLLSGTSAPTEDPLGFYNYFAAENASFPGLAGCPIENKPTVPIISPSGDENTLYPTCFNHPTMIDLFNGVTPNITWRYYADHPESIWNAPADIANICGSLNGGPCNNFEYTNNVVVEGTDNLTPFLRDLGNCDLRQVTWVVPDGRWGDHPNKNNGLGPDYVADIVNAVGGTGPPANNCGFWSNTVILIVWDDWGGFFDHINPKTKIGIGYQNQTGQQYVYGFRVPLLVVSAYVKQVTSTNGYISGALGQPAIYYDFGSILKFIENTFNLLTQTKGINPIYPYADQFAGGPASGLPSGDLSDFFDYTKAARTFKAIPLFAPSPQLCTQTQCMSSQCDAACFINWHGTREAPDDDGDQTD
jgi:hypothetical protein